MKTNGLPTSDAGNPADTARRFDGLLALLVAAAGIIWTGLYFDRGLDAFDAGLFATEAERVAEGGVYGRDFLAPYGPGRYYLIALLFSLFGYSLKVQACLWLVLRGLAGALAYLTGRFFLPRSLAVLPALVILAAPGALHKSFFQVGALLLVLLYLHYRRNPCLLRCGIAGAAAAFIALFRVDVGVFGTLSFIILYLLEMVWDQPRPEFSVVARRIGSFAAGAAGVTLPVVCYFMAVSDIGFIFQAEWHRTLLVSGFADMLHVPSFTEALNAPAPASSKLFLLAVLLHGVPLVYLAVLILAIFMRIRHDAKRGGLEMLGLAVFGIPILNQVRITPTFNHLLHALPLAAISWAVWIHAAKDTGLFRWMTLRSLRWVIAGVLLIIPLALPVYYNHAFTRGVLPGSIRNRTDFNEPFLLARAGIYESQKNVDDLERAVRYIESTTGPDDPLFAGPFSPVLNFLAHRPPAIRFLEPFYYFRNEAFQRLVIEDLERTDPPLILLDPLTRVGGQDLEHDAPLVYAYIKERYYTPARPSVKPARYTIWHRR
ncbi:MAG: hypothetical protein ACYTG7_18585 [Planctomycetota bacterium]|jgi:hypothetical protein